ncbi:MAG TPA: hypothetical protein EYQ00_02470, partial [Dehalococcoidia bacterium]|nr:hypothetical protein [Dehalococcoidia bacterium]
MPDSHKKDLQALNKSLEEAGAKQALERCRRMP